MNAWLYYYKEILISDTHHTTKLQFYSVSAALSIKVQIYPLSQTDPFLIHALTPSLLDIDPMEGPAGCTKGFS